MLALRHPVAASDLLSQPYGALHNGKRKIKKQRPEKLFLIFFRFRRNLGYQLGQAMSNIQMLSVELTFNSAPYIVSSI